MSSFSKNYAQFLVPDFFKFSKLRKGTVKRLECWAWLWCPPSTFLVNLNIVLHRSHEQMLCFLNEVRQKYADAYPEKTTNKFSEKVMEIIKEHVS